jgi:hypothetical protein
MPISVLRVPMSHLRASQFTTMAASDKFLVAFTFQFTVEIL